MKKLSILLTTIIGGTLILSGCKSTTTPTNSISSSSSSISSIASSSSVSSSSSVVSSSLSSSSVGNHTDVSLSGNDQIDITSCERSENANIKKEVLITLEDIKDTSKHEAKHKEAVDLINDCYEVTIKEEYEVQPGEVSSTVGTFKYKIIETDSIFDKLMFYPTVNVYDYDGFVGTQDITYITNSSRDEILKFYEGIQIPGYKETPSDDENILRWTDIKTTENVISLKITPIEGGAYLNFGLTQKLDQE